MTILETMAYDILNISTSIAFIPEVLHDCDNAFLIIPGDVKILATRLRQLIGNESLRHKFNEKSYKLITEKFSFVHNIEELKSIYRQQVD